MDTSDNANTTAPVLFESHYGSFQPRYVWLLPTVGILGVIGVPLGFFWNKGWEMGNHPLEPWAATLIIEIFAIGALLIAGSLGLASTIRRNSPQRVAVTDSTLIVPKGMFSSVELALPLSEIDMTVFNAGIVKQLRVKHNRRTVLLSSALFPSDAEFERLIGYLQR